MWLKNLKHRQRGDTIVEVLIAIGVVSLIVAGAYVTTNRSLLATRAAQERSNALKIAESQLELLKGLAKTDPTAIFGAGTPAPFCVSGTATVVSSSNAACKVDTSGTPTTAQPIFNVAVSRASDGNTFTVLITWANISGDNNDQLRLIYRVYQ